MSVHIPPVDPERDFSVEQRRDIVLAYEQTKHGHKAEYLQKAGVTRRQMERWWRQLAAGTLDIGLTPRKNVRMTDQNIAELARVVKYTKELEEALAQRDALIAQLQAAMAEKDAAAISQSKAVEAMGKAIAAMHHHTDR